MAKVDFHYIVLSLGFMLTSTIFELWKALAVASLGRFPIELHRQKKCPVFLVRKWKPSDYTFLVKNSLFEKQKRQSVINGASLSLVRTQIEFFCSTCSHSSGGFRVTQTKDNERTSINLGSHVHKTKRLQCECFQFRFVICRYMQCKSILERHFYPQQRKSTSTRLNRP